MENNNLNQKFAKVLNEVPNFSTDETANAGNRTYKYLNLATLLKSIKPIFEKNGLAFTQKVTFNGTGDGRQILGTIETIIFDDTDQMTVCEYPFFVTGDPQQVGSAITYARRYSLTTVHMDKTKIQARAAWTRACTKQREMEQMKQGEFHRELPGTRKFFTSA